MNQVIKGIYCLEIVIAKNSQIKVGALGPIDFQKGTYLYIGSAQRNFEKRLMRHLRSEKKLHWHIDYLLTNNKAELKRIFYKEAEKKEECRIADLLKKKAKAIKGFGCSDCSCKSHLFMTEREDLLFAADMKIFPIKKFRANEISDHSIDAN